MRKIQPSRQRSGGSLVSTACPTNCGIRGCASPPGTWGRIPTMPGGTTGRGPKRGPGMPPTATMPAGLPPSIPAWGCCGELVTLRSAWLRCIANICCFCCCCRRCCSCGGGGMCPPCCNCCCWFISCSRPAAVLSGE